MMRKGKCDGTLEAIEISGGTEISLEEDESACIFLTEGEAVWLQYIVETLPVKVDKYLPYAKDIDKEIALLKAWRKSDNKFKGKLCSASNFANVNNNGNANANNASNANGVRPDFDATI